MKHNYRNSYSLKFVSLTIFIFLLYLVDYQCQSLSDFKNDYSKSEYKIEMRDGINLYTVIYSPKDQKIKYPILLLRTPYGAKPYGTDEYRILPKNFAESKYIFAYQDVRGKYKSEGKYVNMRPYIPNKNSKMQVDESSDTYDTINWLVKNIPNNNGNVGIYGISYPGFYAAMGIIDAHPALKAASPQAPIADWFIDDDMHHHGALSLMLSFNFFSRFGQPAELILNNNMKDYVKETEDAYNFFLNVGPISNFNKKYLNGEIDFWNEFFKHETYDSFWKSRNTLPHFNNITPAVMTVGGWFDSEDLYGTLKTYESIEEKNSDLYNILIMGPWYHGAWSRADLEQFGDMKLGSNTSEFYRQNIELPFFEHFLKDKDEINLPEAYVFETGKNKWHTLEKWPPFSVIPDSINFADGGKLNWSIKSLSDSNTFDEYVSDPNRPVPYTSKIQNSKMFYYRPYMVEDQRFASQRPDVLVYSTDTLKKDYTIAGPITADIFISTSGTDSDWIVKIIDVFPKHISDQNTVDNDVEMRSYQMLIRGEIFRGKFRNSYENPQPFIPNQITEIRIPLQDIYHTFLIGHKIMVQIQSSWFPFFDRNPQRFTDIYNARENDFKKAVQRLYHSKKYNSKIIFSKLPAN